MSFSWSLGLMATKASRDSRRDWRVWRRDWLTVSFVLIAASSSSSSCSLLEVVALGGAR